MATNFTGGATSNLDALSVVGTADAATVTQGGVAMPRMVLSTAQNTTSGTSIDFTGIPSWVKRITVMFNGVSTNGTNYPLVQIGAGSIVSSGYQSAASIQGSTNLATSINSTAGFIVASANASAFIHGHMTLTFVSGTTWVCSHCIGDYVGTYYTLTGGGVSPALGGSLDRVRLTTVGGTDTFDAGSVNILYEG